jgi:tetratricopeptide (TPR) repeat protein
MAYEFNFNLAEALMAVGRFEDASARYNMVAFADLNSFPVYRADIDTIGMSAAEIERMRTEGAARTSPINISQGDAGWGAVVALDTLRKVEIAQRDLNSQQAYALPITRRLLTTISEFQQRFPQDGKAAEALYAAASIHFDGSNYVESISMSHRILAAYGTADTAMWRQATKLAADSYTRNEQFDEGIAKYDALIARTRNNAELLQTYVDLAAAAIFQKASRMRDRRQISPAAAEFRTIVARYPNSTVAPLGWFEAAVTYEGADSAAQAAQIFREFPTRFPRHELVQRAFVRSGENFAKAEMFVEAGQIMRQGAQTVNQAEFSIGALGVAAGYFKSAGQLETVGDMYNEIYRMFPTDPQAPQALYNAGLAYEEAKNFRRAIEVYTILGTRYVESEFAPSGYFSIGLAYEQMGDFVKMAEAFVSYARRFTSNRDSQMKALNRAGRAFLELNRTAEAEENFLLATQIFARFRESDALSNEDGAVAFFNLAEIYRARFEQITLTGRNQREVEAAAKRKQEAFQQLAETYMNAAALAIAEWTIRSIHSVGLASKSYATAFRNQTLFGNSDVQMGTRIQLLSGGVHQFYDEAITNFARAVQFAREAGIQATFVSDAEMQLSQMWFMKGYAFQEAGTMVRNTPMPRGLDEEEEMAFIDMVEEFYMNFVKQALPVFVSSIDNLSALFIGKNEWTDSIQARIGILAAELELAGFSFGEISQAEVDLNVERAQARADGRFVVITAAELARREARTEHEQAMSAIGSIVASNMTVSEKLSSLASRRTTAERSMAQETARITELRTRLGL